MVDVARRACRDGRLVWWIGLPAQRPSVLRRVTDDGFTALGLEFMSAQQMYYRLLAYALRSCPLVIGSGRLVRVAEALADASGTLPTPGEARLFAFAIAEAKRFGLSAADVARQAPAATDALGATSAPSAEARAPGDAAAALADPERRRFAEVFAAYELRLEGAWDYDDVRTHAAALACSADAPCEADVVIVDGLREIGPLELRLLQGLARGTEVHLTLPQPPPGCAPTHELLPRRTNRVERHLAPNPVAEARWVLRSVKRDLVHHGLDPLDVAIIVPSERVRAITTLAEEYGVPVMDETPSALADEPAGRTLVDLLEVPDLPTPSRILALPSMAPLANLALQHGVAGADAVALLADRLGLRPAWRAWLRRLEVDGEPVAWARRLVREVLPDCVERVPDRFEELVLRKAQEAARLGTGPGFRAWWAALLRDARQPRREPGGVAVLTATLASGRRFAKAYVLGAVEGAYAAGEREDYFVPEEDRRPLPDVFACLGLPQRFQGRGEGLALELLQRADVVVVTAPEADQGGPLVADAGLLGARPSPLPAVPAGSRMELDEGDPFRPSVDPVPLGAPTVEFLRHYDACSFRAWGERAVLRRAQATDDADDTELDDAGPDDAGLDDAGAFPWCAVLLELLARTRLDTARLAALARQFPAAATWLERHADTLTALTYDVRLGGRGDHAVAQLHAARRTPLGGEAGGGSAPAKTVATIYRFVAPDAVHDAHDASELLNARWTELWAAGVLLEQRGFGVARVDLVVWPLLGEPIPAFQDGITWRWKRIERRRADVERLLPAFRAGHVRPNPGFACRSCAVFDLCREGRR